MHHMTKPWRKGRVVYCQGRWRCEVVEDRDDCFAYIPLEGYAPGDEGRTFHADRDLFTERPVPRRAPRPRD
jgi:hypothetical protein